MGLNFTVAALTEVPLSYLSEKCMTRFGNMPVLIFASAALVVKYAVMATNPPISVIVGIQALDGVGYSLYWSATVQVVTDIAPRERSVTAQTLYVAIAGTAPFSCVGFLAFERLGLRDGDITTRRNISK